MICEIQAETETETKAAAELTEGNKELQAEMKLTSLKEVFLCTWERWEWNEQINK